jgi:hypothetical protein
METAAQTCVRLVAALEDLAAREAATLDTCDFAAAIEIQERAAPLVDHLVAHGPAAADRALRDRIAALLLRRAQTGEWLAAKIAAAREELRHTQVAQRRVARVAPVYGSASAPRAMQLSAVG